MEPRALTCSALAAVTRLARQDGAGRNDRTFASGVSRT
jgi:hypothetical protein